ncbi:zinc-ribbon domain-containing protein [Cellulomonas fimi]|uniref:Zinc-ribbon 15 domain-containing protein n=1 Tax=Cellulomonas fimi TaxID=1708 RepID=A0A7Y0LYX4_CELFI|nr:hypothetical protein [Cellulomonas fimi]NMR20738.1 hypothetical protein [Cellulomonas fimi]
MFLFFGTRLRRRSLGSGVFHCPFCYDQRSYEHADVRTWFHVFWIPLVPLGGGQEIVRCTVCGGEWSPAVLQLDASH